MTPLEHKIALIARAVADLAYEMNQDISKNTYERVIYEMTKIVNSIDSDLLEEDS